MACSSSCYKRLCASWRNAAEGRWKGKQLLLRGRRIQRSSPLWRGLSASARLRNQSCFVLWEQESCGSTRNLMLLELFSHQAVVAPSAVAMTLNREGRLRVLGAELCTGSHGALKEFVPGMITSARGQPNTSSFWLQP